MSLTHVDAIAEALLYEGYLLYPYTAHSIKNRQRFTFGVLHPSRDAQHRGGNDRASMRTELLVRGDDRTELAIHVRFLQLEERAPVPDDTPGDAAAAVPWQEAVRRDVSVPPVSLGALVAAPLRHEFSYMPTVEPGADPAGHAVLRRRAMITGLVRAGAERLEHGLFRVRTDVFNTYDDGQVHPTRDAALLHALVSAHTAFTVRDGAFVSLLEPPPDAALAADLCANEGTWPVLAGERGSHDTMISSPIILYDYPEVAAESAGDFFDAAEIDEILSLRILTLTDEEKRLMSSADDRARRMLERTEALTPQDFARMHGHMRGQAPRSSETEQ